MLSDERSCESPRMLTSRHGRDFFWTKQPQLFPRSPTHKRRTSHLFFFFFLFFCFSKKFLLPPLRESKAFLSRSEGHKPISLGSGDKVRKNKAELPAGRSAPCSPGVGLSALRSTCCSSALQLHCQGPLLQLISEMI